MRKEEYANLELDELIPMMCEIFAKIDIQIFKNYFTKLRSAHPVMRGVVQTLSS